MRKVHTSISIAAPSKVVWAALVDFPAYAEWNPFMTSVSGNAEVGSRLIVRINPPGGRPLTFKPRVLIRESERELRWRGRLLVPGLFDGEHFFKLKPTVDGTELAHGEDFSGIIAHLFGDDMFERTRDGFSLMNKALKRRAEI